MRTIEKSVYTFSELSEKAQEKAVNYFITNWLDEHDFASDVIDDWTEDKLPAKGFDKAVIYYSGFSSQGDGACFTAKVDLNQYFQGMALNKYQRVFLELWCKDYIVAILVKQEGHYLHANTMRTEVSWNNYGVRLSDYWYKEFAQIEKDILADAQSLAREIYKELAESYDYCCSKEYAKEQYDGTGTEFYADGSVYTE